MGLDETGERAYTTTRILNSYRSNTIFEVATM